MANQACLGRHLNALEILMLLLCFCRCSH